jgi:hypothetical protein
VSSTTVLNWRAHGVERVAERRATLLERMVNDMIELLEREGVRYCADGRGECRWTQASRGISIEGQQWLEPMFSACVAGVQLCWAHWSFALRADQSNSGGRGVSESFGGYRFGP